MTVQLFAFTCGFVTIPRHFLLAKSEGFIRVPIPSYLIVHPRGRVLFDTSLHTDIQTDPVGYVGEMLARFHTFDYSSGEEVGARLLAAGVEPDAINLVINSHLHFDHCGGNGQLKNADILIQKRELDHAHAAGVERGYLLNDWETGQRLRTVDGEHDVFGDQTVVCLPTYGHTPGHQSLRIRTELGGEFVLCGDACYLKESLEKLHAPGVIADRDAALNILRRFAEMQARGSRIMFGHDPEFWTSVPQAPQRLG